MVLEGDIFLTYPDMTLLFHLSAVFDVQTIANSFTDIVSSALIGVV